MLEILNDKPESVNSEAAKETEAKQEPQPEKHEDVTFPQLPNGPAVFYETERDEVWIGIPFKQIGEPSFVLAAIDRAKYEALIYLQQHMIKVMNRKKFEVSPLGQRVKQTMADLFGKKK